MLQFICRRDSCTFHDSFSVHAYLPVLLMHLHVFAGMRACMHTYYTMQGNVCVCLSGCLSVCQHTRMHACMHAYTHVCMFVFVFLVCMYVGAVFACLYTHMWICLHAQACMHSTKVLVDHLYENLHAAWHLQIDGIFFCQISVQTQWLGSIGLFKKVAITQGT